MKKKLLYGLVFIIVGIFCSKYIKNINAKRLFNNENTYYFVQEGIYSSKEVMNDDIKNIRNRLIVQDKNKYYVYVGISKSLVIAERVKKIYEQKGYQLCIKEQDINSLEFSNNIEQFDLLINKSTNDEDVLTIESVILSNYEEIINN